MGEQNIERLSILPLAIAIMAILITIVGGTVRIHDAGESCPDWPTCFGTLGFDISSEEQEVWWNDNPDEIDSRGEHHRYTTFEIFVEWFHRLLVGIIAIPIILNVLFVNKKRLELGERVRSLAIFSAILLLVQALAGYATVKFDNVDWTVAVHLTLASTFIAVLIWQWMSWIRVIDPDRAVFSLTKKEAEKMFKILNGKTHKLYSSIAVSKAGKTIWKHSDFALLKLHNLNNIEIKKYLNKLKTDDMRASGLYQIESLGINLFEKIKGDMFTILGLPILPLLNFFKKEKIDVWK